MRKYGVGGVGMDPMQENPMQSIVVLRESRHLHNVIIFSGVRISRIGLRVCLEDLWCFP